MTKQRIVPAFSRGFKMNLQTMNGLSAQHVDALRWFITNRGAKLGWPQPLANGTLLASKAKAIYTPRWMEYALSIRENLNSDYLDSPPKFESRGKWTYEYFQENPDPNQRDNEYTNRALMRCLRDRIPVGVMRQVKPKPDTQYEILGIGLVEDWSNGIFLLRSPD